MATGGSVFTGHEEKLEGEGDSSSSIHLDLISELPDEILVKILSPLTLEEAARTSILSTRWQHLWKSTVTVLNFDVHHCFTPSKAEGILELAKEKRSWYVDWVSGVVRQLQQQHHNNYIASKLTKFRVSFALDPDRNCNFNQDIDRWLEFAVSNKVESLELCMKINLWSARNYPFSNGCFDHIRTADGLADIKLLRTLRLSYVDVDSEVIEHFISSCPFLEELELVWSMSMRKLRVVGSSTSPLRLKHLGLRNCYLKYMEIDHVPHLTHLVYQGYDVRLGVENCTRLVDLSIGIDIFDEMINVINGCPHLYKLTVQMYNLKQGEMNEYFNLPDVGRVASTSVKVVEILGFSCHHFDCIFVEDVLEHFVGLEKIVLDRGKASRSDLSDAAKRSETEALEIKSRANPSIEFVIV